jgi:type II secretory pathway pseudopilin PulG
VIIGILATIVIPQFSDASHQARENALKDDLRYMRTQVGVYKAQHRDVPPGYPGGDTTQAPTLAAFASQMTLATNELGQDNPVNTPVFKYGPYINRMPRNPLNGLDTVAIVAAGPMPGPDDSTGWIYQPQTQAFIANTTGNDANGTPYSSY